MLSSRATASLSLRERAGGRGEGVRGSGGHWATIPGSVPRRRYKRRRRGGGGGVVQLHRSIEGADGQAVSSRVDRKARKPVGGGVDRSHQFARGAVVLAEFAVGAGAEEVVADDGEAQDVGGEAFEVAEFLGLGGRLPGVDLLVAAAGVEALAVGVPGEGEDGFFVAEVGAEDFTRLHVEHAGGLVATGGGYLTPVGAEGDGRDPVGVGLDAQGAVAGGDVVDA